MRNRRGFALASLFVVAGAFAFGVASAQTSAPIALTWNAPAGCSDGETILKEVAELRGDHAANEPMTATASVALDASGVWNLQITTRFSDGTHGERQIRAESCKAAADTTASILALALTNRAQEIAAAASATSTASDTGAPANATNADASTPAAAENTNDDAGPTAAREEDHLHFADSPPALVRPQFFVGLNLGLTLGDFPSVGLGGGGDLGLAYGVFRAEAYANYWAFGRASFTGGGANFQLFSAGLRTCATFGDAFSLGPCAAFEVGSTRAESFDVTRPSSGSALSSDGFLGALGMISLDKNRRISLRALIEVGAAFQRPTFVLDGASFAYQPGPVVGRGTFGAEVRF